MLLGTWTEKVNIEAKRTMSELNSINRKSMKWRVENKSNGRPEQ
jgi:hypothetical protein